MFDKGIRIMSAWRYYMNSAFILFFFFVRRTAIEISQRSLRVTIATNKHGIQHVRIKFYCPITGHKTIPPPLRILWTIEDSHCFNFRWHSAPCYRLPSRRSTRQRWSRRFVLDPPLCSPIVVRHMNLAWSRSTSLSLPEQFPGEISKNDVVSPRLRARKPGDSPYLNNRNCRATNANRSLFPFFPLSLSPRGHHSSFVIE